MAASMPPAIIDVVVFDQDHVVKPKAVVDGPANFGGHFSHRCEN